MPLVESLLSPHYLQKLALSRTPEDRFGFNRSVYDAKCLFVDGIGQLDKIKWYKGWIRETSRLSC